MPTGSIPGAQASPIAIATKGLAIAQVHRLAGTAVEYHMRAAKGWRAPC
jgi:hypothetical protein